MFSLCFFFSSRRRHTRYWRDWSSDVCSSDLLGLLLPADALAAALVGAAVRARLPFHVYRPLAVDTGLLELPVAHGADQEVLLHQVAAVGAEQIGRSTRLNSSHANISYAVFCLKKTIIRRTIVV